MKVNGGKIALFCFPVQKDFDHIVCSLWELVLCRVNSRSLLFSISKIVIVAESWNSYINLIHVDPGELMWVSTVPAQNTEGLPKCLAGSAGTLIKQLSVGTKLSTLTPRDIKPKESFVDVTFSTFLADIMHKRSEAFQIIYLSSL